MIAIKGIESQKDCKKCPFMATDGTDELLSPMMCLALWATKHEVKHCVQGKILDDCPLVEIGIDIGDKDECAIYEYKGTKDCYIDGLMGKERIND